MIIKEKLENWQIEINRLNKMRLDLGLNMNQVEKLTGVNRSRLKGFFDFKNVPSMKFYFDVKEVLENNIEVKFKDVLNNAEFQTTECDCKVENGLLKRGKIKCALSKAEHSY